MANSRVAAELVIRAKNEAERTIEAVGDALKYLFGQQEKVANGSVAAGAGLDEMRKALVAVQGAYKTIDADANRASAAFDKQTAKLAASRAEFAALKDQMQAAKAVLDRLRAANSESPVDAAALKAATAAYRDLVNQSNRLVSDISRQETVIEGSRAAMQRLGSQANAVEAALESVGTEAQRSAILAGAAADETAAKYRGLADAARLSAEQSRFQGAINQALGVGAGAGPQFAADLKRQMEEAAETERQMATAAAALKAQLDPLAAIQDRLNKELAEANALYKAGKISAADLAQATAMYGEAAKRATALSGKGDGRFLGLRPYELQNLSYQINDVFTQLASGTSLTQTLAQQGGQIAQLFPNLMAGIGRFASNPATAAAIIILGTLVVAMKNLADLSASEREFAGMLTATADSASYSAGALAETAHSLDVYGTSLKNARAELKSFIAEGVDPTYLERFGKTAENVAKVMKVDVKDAAKQMAEAFTGGFDAIKKLDDATNFLTLTERNHIKSMFDEGRASDARTEAFRIYERRMDEGAAKMRGPWTNSVRSLTGAWDNFLTFLGNLGPIRGAISLMADLAAAVERVTGLLPGAGKSALENAETGLAELRRQRESRFNSYNAGFVMGPKRDQLANASLAGLDADIKAAEQRVAALRQQSGDTLNQNGQRGAKAGQGTIDRLNDELRSIEAITNAQKLALAGKKAYDDAIKEGATNEAAAAARAKGIQVEQARLDEDARREAERKGEQAASAAKRRAEQAAREAEQRREQIAESIEGLQFETMVIQQAAREQAILNALRAAEDPKKSDPTKPGASLSVADQNAIRTAAGALYDTEQQVKASDEAEKKRKETLADIDEMRLSLAAKRGEEISRQAYIETAAAQKGVDLATAEGQRWAEIKGQIFDIEEAQRRIQAAEKQINDLTALRTAMMEQIEFSENQGQSGAAETLRVRLEAVNLQLQKAIAGSIAMYQALGGTEADAAVVKLQNLQGLIATAGQRSIITGRQINDSIAQGGASAWDQFVEAVDAGQNAIRLMGNAFRSFVSDFLRQIARMIVQQMILNSLQSFGGGGGIGGVIAKAARGVAGVKHGGGMAGASGRSRSVPTAIFAQATRYHTGGIPGLKPNEVPIIAENTEEIITKDDPRHRDNGGLNPSGPGGANVSLTNVNVFDAEEMVKRGLGTRVGEQTVLNIITENAGAVNAALGK